MKLRSMTMADADFMLMLKNYPETRQFAIASHEAIDAEDHYRWLEKNLQYFQVIEDLEKSFSRPPEEREKVVSVGVIRIHDNEVSIWIDKKYWKLGIATYVLQHHAQKGNIARIVNGNVGSFKAFVRAGFEPVSYSDNYYTLKKW